MRIRLTSDLRGVLVKLAGDSGIMRLHTRILTSRSYVHSYVLRSTSIALCENRRQYLRIGIGNRYIVNAV